MTTQSSPKPPPPTTLLGPLIRLRPLHASQLPTHPLLPSPTTGPSIQSLAASALSEATTFLDTYLPTNFALKSSGKWSPPSAAPVELYAKDIPSSALPYEGAKPESWYARRSVHENKPAEGTASWEEFDAGLRVDHSVNELDYTPGVLDAHELLNWEEQLATTGGKVDGGWEDVVACVREMVHRIPQPLDNRVFPVLIITARKGQTLLVVQMPVVTEGLPGVKYKGAAKITEGVYCSVERCEVVEEGSKVKWEMATASDAMGNLPMWTQKLGVPTAVIKDVGFFLLWVAQRRGKTA